MFVEDKKAAWTRSLIGGGMGVLGCLVLGFLLQPGYLFGAPPSFDFTFCLNSLVPEGLGTALAFLLWFLFGAEIGIATLPFADGGRSLLLRSLAHFCVMALTLWAWVVLNFFQEPWSGLALTFLLPFTLVYVLVWLGRWVGWYAEVDEIREKLGLTGGPSPLKWRETLPHLGFALLLCLIVPTVLRLCDAPDVPVLSGLLYPYLLLPVGGFCSAYSLGKRQGFCPLYPSASTAFIAILALMAKLYSNMADGFLLPMALLSTLGGNLAGMAVRERRKRTHAHEQA